MKKQQVDFITQLVMFWSKSTWIGKTSVILGMPLLLLEVFVWSITWGLFHH